MLQLDSKQQKKGLETFLDKAVRKSRKRAAKRARLELASGRVAAHEVHAAVGWRAWVRRRWAKWIRSCLLAEVHAKEKEEPLAEAHAKVKEELWSDVSECSDVSDDSLSQ